MSFACSPKEADHSHGKADAIGRHILGPAQPLPLQNSSSLKESDVTASLRLTRLKAWEIFAEAVRDVNLEISLPNGEKAKTSLPRFMTWYSLEDANRLFALGLENQSSEGKIAGTSLTKSEADDAERKLIEELKSLPSPVQKKWEKFFTTNPELNREALLGASGLPRTMFNAEVLKSALENYRELQDCFGESQTLPAFDQAAAPCFSKGLDTRSITVKTNWLRTDAKFRKFSTDADSLRSVMASEESSWDDLQVETDVPTNIVKATMNGRSFVLGGLHLVSKEFKDWIWVSAWWSDSPDTDFGEDRPDFVKALGAPWNQYKICAVSSFVQSDKELDEIAKTHPSLASAYREVLKESGASWCSNPYIERGVNNQKTNCIGCHQFAGTDVSQFDIISDAERFPALGNLKQRSDFPVDYIWSAAQGQISWFATLNSLRFEVQVN